MSRQSAAGFTLLEAIVALAIFAAAAMALYGLFSANLSTLSRVQDASVQVPLVQEAVERLSLINPRQQAAGQFAVDEFEVVWTARLLEPVRQSQNAAGFRGDYEIGLYQVDFEIQRGDRRLGSWQLRLTGHEKVRQRGWD